MKLLTIVLAVAVLCCMLSCEKKKTTEPEIDTCATPAFTPGAGDYTLAQNVSIISPTVGATIYYTNDGSDPTSDSAVYTSPIAIDSTTTIKAIVFKAGWTESAIAAATYTIEIAPDPMVLVAGGTFNNGVSDVTISSFYISKYELTQAEYLAIMGENPSFFTSNTSRPVEQVTWFDAIECCNRRSIKEGFTPCYSYLTYGTNPASWPEGWNSDSNNHTDVTCNWTANGYRLPTEAEWGFAARGGNQTHSYTYSGSNTIDAVAWYTSNSRGTSHAVGIKTANELGLFDMSGNVWEWMWDIYGNYPSGAQTNPQGAVNGSYRVLRGGGWLYSADHCTVFCRNNLNVNSSEFDIGIRCVRNAE